MLQAAYLLGLAGEEVENIESKTVNFSKILQKNEKFTKSYKTCLFRALIIIFKHWFLKIEFLMIATELDSVAIKNIIFRNVPPTPHTTHL